MSASLQTWWDEGARVGVGAHELFVWEGGPADGPVVAFVHGYPGSSHDAASLARTLTAAGWRVLVADLLGFGASDKPDGHAYAITEQADLLEELWAARGVRALTLIAHDYGLSVAQEMLARRVDDPARLPVVEATVLMNGGAIPQLHRPTDGQKALLDPEHGQALADMASLELFGPGLAATFGPAHQPTPQQLDDLWAAIARDDGPRLLSQLLHYIAERREHAPRWAGALRDHPAPLTLVWGPEDPVSGAHMLAGLRELAPQATVHELDGVGHWPTLEDPGRTEAAVLAALR